MRTPLLWLIISAAMTASAAAANAIAGMKAKRNNRMDLTPVKETHFPMQDGSEPVRTLTARLVLRLLLAR